MSLRAESESVLEAAPRTPAELGALLEAVPDAIVGVGDDGLIALANASAERLFGYPSGALAGQPLEVLVPERSRMAHALNQRAFLAAPSVRPMGAGLELCGRRRDGSEFPAEI